MKRLYRYRRFVVVVFAACFAGLLSAEAETLQLPAGEKPLPEDLTVPASLVPEGQPLSLDEATRLAVARNLNMHIARFENQREAEEVGIAQGVFDTRFKALGSYEQDHSQRSSVILGTREIEGKVRAELEKKLATGTDVTLSAESRRNSTTSSFTGLNPGYSGTLEIRFKQPLLRNFFGFVDRAEIKKVRLNVKKFRYGKLEEIEAELLDVRAAYWDLVFADENLKARYRALETAQAFYRSAMEKLDIGLSEKPDVYAAEANVRTRVIEVREAVTRYHAASYALKILLDRPEVPFIEPSTAPEFYPLETDLKQGLVSALNSRWDLKQTLLDIESQAIDLKIARNRLWPELNFEGSYASTSLDRDRDNSLGEIYAFNHPQYFAGVVLETPLERREEKGRLEQSKLQLRVFEQTLRNTQNKILKEVDNRFRLLKLAGHEVLQREEIASLERNKLKTELKQFHLGRSASKTIIDYQEDVINAEILAIRARVGFRKAVDAYYRAQNRLLAEAGVTERGALTAETQRI